MDFLLLRWVIVFGLSAGFSQSLLSQETPAEEKVNPKVEAIRKSWDMAQNQTNTPREKTSPAAATKTAVVHVEGEGANADSVPPGQELVAIDFPDPTDIKDIIRAVSLWTGKNVILGRDVSGNVQMISPRKVTKEEAYQAFLSALNLLGLTTVETGKVIKILPVRTAVKGNLETYLGSSWTPMTDKVITQIIPLKYIDAKQIQTTLSRIVSSNSMIAYPPTNTLIISDSGYKVKRILDIIQLLDVQGQQPKLEIVPIRFADAKSIASKVSEIYKSTSGAGPKAAGAGGSQYLTYKIMPDERSNSVVIFGPPRTIQDVKELVRKFDIRVEDPSRQSSIHVRPLDYADAKKIAATLSALAQGQSAGASTLRRPPIARPSRTGNAANVGGGSSPAEVAQFNDNLKITADESSNSLLITGSRAAYNSVNSIIRRLDIRKSQVYVEADIIDVNVKGGFEAGTSVFAGAGKENGAKMAYTWQGAQIGSVLQAQALSGQTTDSRIPVQELGRAMSTFSKDFTVGILAGKSVDIPGIGKISPGALIKLIKTDSNSKSLASPHILTSNNEEASISVGKKLFYKTNEVSGVSGVSAERVQSEDVDLTLEIKPNISNTNYVTMTIKLEANIGDMDPVQGVPTVNKRKMSQIVTVKNSQTVVISGLMETNEQESFQKIPLLGDIPILGWLFRNSMVSKERNNLMVFLTPHIVHGANDLAAIYDRKVVERDEYFKMITGNNYKDDYFYRKLPQRDDGKHVADAFDKLEYDSRQKMMRNLRRDMGYSDAEIREIEEEELRADQTEASAGAAHPSTNRESRDEDQSLDPSVFNPESPEVAEPEVEYGGGVTDSGMDNTFQQDGGAQFDAEPPMEPDFIPDPEPIPDAIPPMDPVPEMAPMDEY